MEVLHKLQRLCLNQDSWLQAINLDTLHRKEVFKALRGSQNHQNDGVMMARKVERNQDSCAESKHRNPNTVI